MNCVEYFSYSDYSQYKLSNSVFAVMIQKLHIIVVKFKSGKNGLMIICRFSSGYLGSSTRGNRRAARTALAGFKNI